MKKRFLSASLAVILTASAVYPVSMQEVRATNEPNKSDFAIAQEKRVTAKEFLDLAVTALTFQHGSDTMRQQVIADWVKDGELKNLSFHIKQDEIARILVRALGQEENEKKI